VETKNRTLEETAALFDGEDAIHMITHQAHEKGKELTHENGSTESA
jgi:hypothetical protein